MPDPRFSPFGTPLIPVEQFTLAERLQMLRADMAGWRYGRCSPFVGAWLAAGIEKFLRDGGDLAAHLALRPLPGSTATPARIEQLHERDALLVKLSVAAGSGARARRILAGDEQCPKRCVQLVEALKQHPIPRSKAAFTRAKVSCLQR